LQSLKFVEGAVQAPLDSGLIPYSDWRNFRRDYFATKERLEAVAEAAFQKDGEQGPDSLHEMRRRWGRWPSVGGSDPGRAEIENVRKSIEEIVRQYG
jgi:hypothetical protein